MLRESDDFMMSIGTSTTISGPGGEEDHRALPDIWANPGEQHGNDCDPAHANSFTSTLPEVPQTTHFRLTESQWQLLERGLRQRFEAVSVCMEELTRHQRVPQFLERASGWKPLWQMLSPAISGIERQNVPWGWFASSDIQLTATGELSVFDHNFSLPTGLDRLASILTAASAPFFSEFTRQIRRGDGVVFVLDPGPFSATYRGNEFLARVLNAKIGKAADLVVRSDGVYVQSPSVLTRVSTIIRRVDDDLLDPNSLRPDSLVGLPGLIRAWRNGVVNVASPPGAALANIRSFGRLIPTMIREFLGEEPVLRAGQIIELSDSDERQRVLDNIEHFAIRTNDPLHPARPYFGRTGSRTDLIDLMTRILRNPEGYIARPLMTDHEAVGMNLRLYASLGRSFRLLRVGLARMCQPDGGAPLIINSDAPMVLVE